MEVTMLALRIKEDEGWVGDVEVCLKKADLPNDVSQRYLQNIPKPPKIQKKWWFALIKKIGGSSCKSLRLFGIRDEGFTGLKFPNVI